MNTIEKYDGELIERSPANFEMPPESASESTSALAAAVLRRWYIVVLIFLVTCASGIPAIWLLIDPLYDVTGAIKVAPILSNILTGEADKGEISNYQSFMNTQAEMVLSPQVVQRVADDLAGKNLGFFEDQANGIGAKLRRRMENTKTKPDPANILKQAKYDGIITSTAIRNTELVKVTAKSDKPEEAKQIVDAFIRSYMAVEGLRSIEGEDRKLSVLENERRALTEKLQNQREAIRRLAEEYGTDTLDGRQDMMLQRVAALLTELTRVESLRMSLEAEMQLLEEQKQDTRISDEILTRRNEYINADITVQELTHQIVQLEQDLIAAKQTLAPANPILRQKQEFMDAFQSMLDERRAEVAKSFDEMVSEEIGQANKEQQAGTRAKLVRTIAYEQRLREKLADEDAQTIGLGRKQLTIQDMQYELELDKQLYDTLNRRLRELEMERKRPARVSVAYNADIAYIADKRIKYSLALVFASLALGMLLAIVLDKADHSLYSPDDVVRRIGIRIIGTTTNPHAIKKALLPRQLVEDYQTIRANLGLLDDGVMPKKVVVTSPGMRDGKTTFAINLATSMAQAAKKVLLIDGDLRKPDIAALLDIPRHARSLQNFLRGTMTNGAVYSMHSTGLDVLAADSHDGQDIYELLSSPGIAERIDAISLKYEHVIIDAPPILAFPDALLWAKMAGAVVLTSFAGRTTAPDLKDAKEKLVSIDVRVLGTVLSNVKAEHSYYRYGYNYHSQGPRRRKNAGGGKPLLLPTEKPPDTSRNPTA